MKRLWLKNESTNILKRLSYKQKMSAPPKMYSSCVEWLDDWTEEIPDLVDEWDLQQWIEEEMTEAIQSFLSFAFRKGKTKAEALEVFKALLWETYRFRRQVHISNIAADLAAVSRLQALPQTTQKSAAWHAEARELLTGHEFGTVVHGTENAINAVVAKKCVAVQECLGFVSEEEEGFESRTVYRTPLCSICSQKTAGDHECDTKGGKLSPFQWGWRYEPVIRQLFEEEIAHGRVDDSLGRIRHPTLPNLAASPDGLIVDGPKAGRLVEIKAPFSRTLSGEIPAEYYCQMQLQAEVTNTAAVEYIEVRFDATPFATSDFLHCPSSSPSSSIPAKMGTILIVCAKENVEDPYKWHYAYSPIWNLDEEGMAAANVWKPAEFMEEADVIVERSVWKVVDWWTTTVPRNPRWWAEVGYPAYKDFWERVEEARADGRYQSKLLIVDSDDEE